MDGTLLELGATIVGGGNVAVLSLLWYRLGQVERAMEEQRRRLEELGTCLIRHTARDIDDATPGS